MKKLFIIMYGIIIGLIIGYFLISYTTLIPIQNKSKIPLVNILLPQNKVIGFLPYWLLSQAKPDYANYITTLTYFGLNLDTDGTILKLSDPTEEEPGWSALSSGIVYPFLIHAKKNGVSLSLLVFDGNQDSIDRLLDDPIPHAKNLIHEVGPLMKQNGFSDLNLDIESVIPASDGAQMRFTQFVTEVKKGLDADNLGTLTIEISPTDLIRHDLIYPRNISNIVDNIVIMAYDYHFTNSYVTGPVAPLGGAGTESEYDTQTAVQKALAIIPSEKIILGIPLYGYGWETISNFPRAAIIPDTGLTQSSSTVAKFLSSCASCSAKFNTTDQEAYLIYHDQDTGTYHQIFYPNQKSTTAKIKFARQENLEGLAVWALGYEDSSILNPLSDYK